MMSKRRISPVPDPTGTVLLVALGAASCTTILNFPEYHEASTSGGGGAGGITTTAAGGGSGVGGIATTSAGGAGGAGGITTTSAGGAGGAGGAVACGQGGQYAPGPGGATGACRWSRSYGERPADVGFPTHQDASRIAATADGLGVVITGTFGQSIDLGMADSLTAGVALFVARVEAADGTTTWQKAFVGTQLNARAMAVDSHGIVLGGAFGGGTLTFKGTLSSAGTALFVAKLDGEGKPLWEKSFPIATVDGAATGLVTRVGTDAVGNIYAGGTFHGAVDFGKGLVQTASVGAPSDLPDAFLVKLDPDGNTLWSKSWGDTTMQTLESLAVDSVGDTYLVGEYAGSMVFGATTLTSAGGSDVTATDSYVAKIDPNGAPLWAQSYGDATERQSAQGVALGKSGLIVIGDLSGSMSFQPVKTLTVATHSTFVAKLSVDGAPIAASAFAGGDWSADAFVTEGPGDAAYVTGRFPTTLALAVPALASQGDEDVFLAKLTVKNGDLVPAWAARYGDVRRQIGTGVAIAGGRLFGYGTFYGTIAFGCGTLAAAYSGACFGGAAPTADVFLTALDL